jgi:N-acetylneuraminate epimerase
VSGEHLVVAGGANFPEAKPWAKGTKVWSDAVWVWDAAKKAWRLAGRLPGPGGYGVSAATEEGMLCLGGSDAKEHHAECLELRVTAAGLKVLPFPGLPERRANGAGLRMGDRLYVFGGMEKPDATEASAALWSLDLKAVPRVWRVEAPLPGVGRIFPTVGSDGERLYVMGGASLSKDAEGKAKRQYLAEAWTFSPGSGWELRKDVPRAVLGCPSPAPVLEGVLHLWGGDDGALAGKGAWPGHPGFPAVRWEWDLKSGEWTEHSAARAVVTCPCVLWQGAWLRISGEVRPAIRTPQVTRFSLSLRD